MLTLRWYQDYGKQTENFMEEEVKHPQKAQKWHTV